MGTRLVLIPCALALITLSAAAVLDLDASVRKFEGDSLVGDYDIFVKQGRCPDKISHAAFAPVELNEAGGKFDAYSIKHSDISQDDKQCTSTGNFAIVPNSVINAAGYRDALGEQAPVVQELLKQNAQFLVGVELAERTCGDWSFSENALAIFIEQDKKVLVPGLITLYPGARYMVIYEKNSPTPCTYFQAIPGRSIGEAGTAAAAAASAGVATATDTFTAGGSGEGGSGEGGSGKGGSGEGGSGEGGSGEGGSGEGGSGGEGGEGETGEPTADVGKDGEAIPAPSSESVAGAPADGEGEGEVAGAGPSDVGSGGPVSAGSGTGEATEPSGGAGEGTGSGAGPVTGADTGDSEGTDAEPSASAEGSGDGNGDGNGGGIIGGTIGGAAAGVGAAGGSVADALGLGEEDGEVVGFGFPEESVEPIEEEDGGSVCFPADATVELENGNTVMMESLQLGDRVLVGPNTYSDVFMFTHRMSTVKYPFVQLETVSGKTITLTSGHYLYINGKLSTAGSATVGDNTSDGRIVGVRHNVMKRGLYNPQTTHGDVFVNGIRASTFTTAVEPNTAHCMLAPMRSLYSALGFSTQLLHQGADTIASVLPSGSS